jgi:hypothetical protein
MEFIVVLQLADIESWTERGSWMKRGNISLGLLVRAPSTGEVVKVVKHRVDRGEPPLGVESRRSHYSC